MISGNSPLRPANQVVVAEGGRIELRPRLPERCRLSAGRRDHAAAPSAVHSSSAGREHAWVRRGLAPKRRRSPTRAKASPYPRKQRPERSLPLRDLCGPSLAGGGRRCGVPIDPSGDVLRVAERSSGGAVGGGARLRRGQGGLFCSRFTRKQCSRSRLLPRARGWRTPDAAPPPAAASERRKLRPTKRSRTRSAPRLGKREGRGPRRSSQRLQGGCLAAGVRSIPGPGSGLLEVGLARSGRAQCVPSTLRRPSIAVATNRTDRDTSPRALVGSRPAP